MTNIFSRFTTKKAPIVNQSQVDNLVKDGLDFDKQVILSAKLEKGGVWEDVQGVVERLVPFYENGVITKVIHEGVVLKQDKETIARSLASMNLSREENNRFARVVFDKRTFEKEITVAEFEKMKSSIKIELRINPTLVYDLFKSGRNIAMYASFTNGFENIKNFQMDSFGVIETKNVSQDFLEKGLNKTR